MRPRTMLKRIRQRLCLHRRAYVKASTGLERSGSRHSGNGSVGVTVTCPDCRWQACGDATMALPPEVREALWGAGGRTTP